MLFEFAGEDAGRAQDLHDSYVLTGRHGRVVGRDSFSMVIAQLADRPFTMAMVDSLLDAVRG